MVHKTILHSREEWLANRRKGIGGSDAACIVGLNPWKSNVELWEELTDRKKKDDISDKEAVKYGTNAEQYLRELFKLDFSEYAVGYDEYNSFYNDKYPWAKASLDGWLFDGKRYGILEIKTTNILQSMQKEKWHDRIPDNYFCQILHYMAVTEYEFVVLKAQLKTTLQDGNVYLQTKHYKIERSDVEADIEYLMQEEQKFWEEYVLKDKRPPLLLPAI